MNEGIMGHGILYLGSHRKTYAIHKQKLSRVHETHRQLNVQIKCTEYIQIELSIVQIVAYTFR